MLFFKINLSYSFSIWCSSIWLQRRWCTIVLIRALLKPIKELSFWTKEWILPLILDSDLTLQAIQNLNINPKLNNNHRERQAIKKTDIPEAMLISRKNKYPYNDMLFFPFQILAFTEPHPCDSAKVCSLFELFDKKNFHFSFALFFLFQMLAIN